MDVWRATNALKNKDQRCAVDDDAANEYLKKITQAQVLYSVHLSIS